MYTRSAQFYDELYHFKDYSAESEQLHSLIQQYNPNARTLLDVACGTGKHLEFMQQNYLVEGLDLSPELLEIASRRCPGVTLHQGNMIDFDLGVAFDVVVCLFSSVALVKTLENLYRAVASMARHLRRGGVLFVEPWYTPSNYWKDWVKVNFVDKPELKIVWMYTQQVEGRVSVENVNYLVGTPQGVQYFKERLELGLFTHEEYLRAFRQAGLEVHHHPKGLWGRGMYAGVHNTPNSN